MKSFEGARSWRHEPAFEEESGIRKIPSAPFEPAAKIVSPAIATGGMASVHLLVSGGRLLALKRLLPHLANDDYHAKMLLDEAALAKCVRHPNVVTTYGAEMVDGRPSIVMDYVPGLPLHTLMDLSEPGAIPPRFAVAIAAQALRGLHAAHEARNEHGQALAIVHRDVSPQNIHVGTDGVTRVLDFGIAKGSHDRQVTRAGDVKGKLSYLSPEQIVGDRVDRRADIRAVAVVLWESLVGDSLFLGDSDSHTVANIVEGAVAAPSELVDGLAPELDAIVLRGLALRPADRWSTALEMACALEALLETHPVERTEIAAWVRSLGRESLAAETRAVVELRRRATPVAPPSPIAVVPWWPQQIRRLLEPLMILVLVLGSAVVAGTLVRGVFPGLQGQERAAAHE